MRVAASAVTGTNAAVDVAASLPRYVAELREALAAELPDLEIDLAIGDACCEVSGADDATRGALELRALGVARAVRHCGRWVVYE